MIFYFEKNLHIILMILWRKNYLEDQDIHPEFLIIYIFLDNEEINIKKD